MRTVTFYNNGTLLTDNKMTKNKAQILLVIERHHFTSVWNLIIFKFQANFEKELLKGPAWYFIKLSNSIISAKTHGPISKSIGYSRLAHMTSILSPQPCINALYKSNTVKTVSSSIIIRC
jgi:hypothetical protein